MFFSAPFRFGPHEHGVFGTSANMSQNLLCRIRKVPFWYSLILSPVYYGRNIFYYTYTALCIDFIPYVNELGPAVSVLKHQRLVSAIMTTLYVTLLKTMNKEVKIDISEPMELTSEFY